MPPSPWSFLHRTPLKSAPAFLSPPKWIRSVFILAKIALSFHVFEAYIGFIGSTQGISMTPTIAHSYTGTPWVLFSSLHRRGRNIKVGDVITYTHPILPNEFGCKRVVGMPGDFVSVITPGRVDEVHAEDTEGDWANIKEQVVRVPMGHCWVAGDNLEWSRDSRLFGPLPLGLVKAKVLAVVSPFGQAKWLGSGVDVVDSRDGEREWVVQ